MSSWDGRPPEPDTEPVCHDCRRPLPPDGRFCDGCGSARDGGRWSVAIDLDRDYFAVRNGAARGFALPAESPPTRRVRLEGDRMRIGRCSRSRDLHPEIDLWGDSPRDPCVSREHAELRLHQDGSWAVLDVGSTNGTFLDGGSRRISTGHAQPLCAGDHVHVGVWTRLTLCRG